MRQSGEMGRHLVECVGNAVEQRVSRPRQTRTEVPAAHREQSRLQLRQTSRVQHWQVRPGLSHYALRSTSAGGNSVGAYPLYASRRCSGISMQLQEQQMHIWKFGYPDGAIAIRGAIAPGIAIT